MTLAARVSLLALDNTRPVADRPASKIVVSGLSGSVTSTGTLPISGSGVAVFGGSAEWDASRGGGELTLTVLTDTQAYREYIIEVNLTNPSEGQFSPTVMIRSTGVTIHKVNMTKDADNAAPLLIASFIDTSIAQHTPAQSAENLLSITLATRCILPASTEVTISGLLGARPSWSRLNVSAFSSEAGVFGEWATWDFERGLLVFKTVGDTEARRRYVLGVTIRNGDTPQFAPPLQIAAGPDLIIQRNEATLRRATGNEAPLLIAGFLTTLIQQSNASAGASNVLVVEIELNCLLPVVNPALFPPVNGSRITISGLFGVRTASTSQMPIVATRYVTKSWHRVNISSVRSVRKLVNGKPGDNVSNWTHRLQEQSIDSSNATFFNATNSSNATYFITVNETVVTEVLREKGSPYYMFRPHGEFNATLGTLVVTVANDLAVNTSYNLSFEVLNSFAGQVRISPSSS